MGYNEKDGQKISARKAMQLLEKGGRKLTEEQARKVVEHLYFLAELVVAQHFTKKK